MTDSLVERLREYRIGCGVHCSDYSNREPLEECLEAANRIEELEETIRWVLGMIGHDHPAKKVIRATLGEK